MPENDFTTEQWKPLCSAEYTIYEISNLGRVRSTTTRVLKQVKNLKGYLSVRISCDGKWRNLLIARLVAAAFIGKREENLEVNHKDGNKENNSVSNLEYLTHSQNMKHAYDTGLKKKEKDHFFSTSVKGNRGIVPKSWLTDEHRIKNGLLRRGKPAFWSRKLTEEQAAEIREMHEKPGFNHVTIAKSYGVCRRTIYNLVHGKHY